VQGEREVPTDTTSSGPEPGQPWGRPPADRRRRGQIGGVPTPPGFPDGFVATAADRQALLVLASLRGSSPGSLHDLAWIEGSASACLDAVRGGAAGSDADQAFSRTADPAVIEASVHAVGARFVVPGDREFVSDLTDLQTDPPVGLFVRGRSLDEMSDRVSMVGARNCSALGNEIAMDIGAGLGAAGVCVVSGAARGIDAASHRGALGVGGSSIAVLGSGLDLPYPKGSAQLLERIISAGAIVSEYPPGVQAEPFRFPARNRIVAALGRALVVVEGADGSGSMISVEHALELGREVFAVPGTVTSPLAHVPLALIREGATMIRGADDLLDDLGLAARPVLSAPGGLTDAQRRVFDAVVDRELPDAIAARARMPVGETLPALLDLEICGLVRSVGGRFERGLVRRTEPG
jgi:DNA processing protein